MSRVPFTKEWSFLKIRQMYVEVIQGIDVITHIIELFN